MTTLADKLASEYNTHDPFLLAERMGITVRFFVFEKLIDVYYRCNDQRFIYLNDTLNSEQQRIACAHCIGHDQLHSDLLPIAFMREQTEHPICRLEKEATTFAIYLLYPETIIDEYTFSLINSAMRI